MLWFVCVVGSVVVCSVRLVRHVALLFVLRVPVPPVVCFWLCLGTCYCFVGRCVCLLRVVSCCVLCVRFVGVGFLLCLFVVHSLVVCVLCLVGLCSLFMSFVALCVFSCALLVCVCCSHWFVQWCFVGLLVLMCCVCLCCSLSRVLARLYVVCLLCRSV